MMPWRSTPGVLGACALAAAALLLGGPARGGEFTPDDLTQVERTWLSNGLMVLMKPLPRARRIAVRLVIDVGLRDGACPKRETAHVLEHMLFMGTDGFDEAELERRVESHGGYWNATTGHTATGYQLEIPSVHADLGLRTLHGAVARSTLTAEKLERARDVVYREAGGRPSAIEDWLYRNGLDRGAHDRAYFHLFPEHSLYCPGLDEARRVTLDDVKEMHARHYVPSNMTLVIAGRYERADLVRTLEATFGALAEGPRPPDPPAPPYPETGARIEGGITPLVDRDAAVAVKARVPGQRSEEFFALLVLARYLNSQLYERIRIDNSLSYAPQARYWYLRDAGVLTAQADAKIDDTERVLAIIEKELRGLVQEGPDPERLAEAKRGMLLGFTQIFESTNDYADYFATWHERAARRGEGPDLEAGVRAVGADQIHRLARAYLQPDARVIAITTPLLTYAQVYTGAAALAVLLAALIAYWLLRRRRRRDIRLFR